MASNHNLVKSFCNVPGRPSRCVLYLGGDHLMCAELLIDLLKKYFANDTNTVNNVASFTYNEDSLNLTGRMLVLLNLSCSLLLYKIKYE